MRSKQCAGKSDGSKLGMPRPASWRRYLEIKAQSSGGWLHRAKLASTPTDGKPSLRPPPTRPSLAPGRASSRKTPRQTDERNLNRAADAAREKNMHHWSPDFPPQRTLRRRSVDGEWLDRQEWYICTLGTDISQPTPSFFFFFLSAFFSPPPLSFLAHTRSGPHSTVQTQISDRDKLGSVGQQQTGGGGQALTQIA
jgi:hypothetical protein